MFIFDLYIYISQTASTIAAPNIMVGSQFHDKPRQISLRNWETKSHGICGKKPWMLANTCGYLGSGNDSSSNLILAADCTNICT